MAGRRAQTPRALDQATPPDVEDPATSRALADVTAAVQKLQGERSQQLVEMDLVVGTNVVPHSLGRAAKVVIITPTVADASFAYALTKSHLLASKQALITVVGVAQPNASLLLM